MNTSLTQHGVENLQETLESFWESVSKALSSDVIEDIRPVNNKTLRKFKMREACTMIGRSDAFLRNLAQSNPDLAPEKIGRGGRLFYTLEQINKIRDLVKTRFKRPKGSKPIIMAVSNFKGGVGKSTTTNSLACKMALEGMRVLVIGLDAQGTDSLFFGLIPDLDTGPDDTIKPALLERPERIKDIIRKTFFDGISIIPGNLGLTQVEMELTNYQLQMNQCKKIGCMPDERLSMAIEYIKEDYDAILLDCGPNSNILTINALDACNALLVPVPPALPDVASFSSFCKTLSDHFKSTDNVKSLDFFKILITKYSKNKPAENMKRQIGNIFRGFVMQKGVPVSAEIEKCAAKFCSLYEQEKSSQPTYLRALNSLDEVFNEIFDAIKEVWDAQETQMEELNEPSHV